MYLFGFAILTPYVFLLCCCGFPVCVCVCVCVNPQALERGDDVTIAVVGGSFSLPDRISMDSVW